MSQEKRRQRGKAVVNKEPLALHHTLAETVVLRAMVTGHGTASAPGLPAGRSPGRPAAVLAHNKTLQFKRIDLYFLDKSIISLA